MLGMVYWDCPFGVIPFCEWDKVLSEEEFEEVFKQISAVIKSQTCVCIFKVHHSQMGMIEELMLKHKFVDAHPLYWWKTDQNVVGLKRYTFAVETLMVGYLGGRAQNQFNEAGLRANPENRHNLITTKSLRKHFINADDELPANLAESPPELVYQLGQVHLSPMDKVLIIGAGSGADIIGSLMNGCDVVAIENNERQFSGCVQRMNAYMCQPEFPATPLPPAMVHRLGLTKLISEKKGTRPLTELARRVAKDVERDAPCICGSQLQRDFEIAMALRLASERAAALMPSQSSTESATSATQEASASSAAAIASDEGSSKRKEPSQVSLPPTTASSSSSASGSDAVDEETQPKGKGPQKKKSRFS